jgi:signal transduction histidine kinase
MQVFTSVMVLGLCFAAFIITDIKGYKERKISSMISLANVVGTNSISAIEFLDNDAAQDILLNLKKVSPEIIHATILDNKGNAFATYSKTGADTFRFHAPPAGEKFEFLGEQLLVYNNIVANNAIIGTVCLQVELSELAAIKKQKYQIAIVLLILGIGLAFIIALIVQGYISRRLLYLVNVMNQVSKTGDYTKHVVVDGRDEINTLSFVFNNLMNQIQESHKKKDDFIGIASHELRTPLTSIKAYLQVLDEIETKQPNKKYVEKTIENVNKLLQLILDLLDVSKIQSGQLELDISEFDIDTLIDETISSYQIVSPNHEIIRGGMRIDQTISGDRQRIEQVFINLLSNAVKYSPGAHKIIVHTSKTGSELIISVTDFGIGIPKEEQAKVFERFYRRKDLSNHISGFGLGLYICQDIIKRHQGKIWIESEGKGAAFYFSLPLSPVLTAAVPV